jgi:hypothetical protein
VSCAAGAHERPRAQETPNPNSLKFLPGRAVMGADGGTVDFQSVKHAQRSPLALRLFQVEGVVGVLFGADFVAVNVRDGTDWMTVKPEVRPRERWVRARGQHEDPRPARARRCSPR